MAFVTVGSGQILFDCLFLDLKVSFNSIQFFFYKNYIIKTANGIMSSEQEKKKTSELVLLKSLRLMKKLDIYEF